MKNFSLKQRSVFRIVAGLVIAVSSSATAWLMLSDDSKKTEIWVAAQNLPAGASISSNSFRLVEIDMGSASGLYLTKDELPAQAYVLGPVRSGEFISKANLATAVLDDRAPVVVWSNMPLARGIVPGSTVDIWAWFGELEEKFQEPVKLVDAAEVANVSENDGVFANSQTSVELWVPQVAVGEVLKAVGAEAKISIVLRPTLID